MRPTVIAGNWKMYNDLSGTETLVSSLVAGLDFELKNVQVVICPPFTSLSLASSLSGGSPIQLGAQNMSAEDEGAFTGEISHAMLRSVGCTHVIIGHSERRKLYGETDAGVNAKVKKALTSGLTPIMCVGESLEEREKGVTANVVTGQVKGGLAGVSAADAARTIIAYEPVWAIGTGKTATPAQAQEVHATIRHLLATMYDKTTSDKIVIQYGGSVKPDNAADLLSQPDIDGALVGGACLKAESFLSIIRAGIR